MQKGERVAPRAVLSRVSSYDSQQLEVFAGLCRAQIPASLLIALGQGTQRRVKLGEVGAGWLLAQDPVEGAAYVEE